MDNGNLPSKAPDNSANNGTVYNPPQNLRAVATRALVRAAVYASAFLAASAGLATWTCDAPHYPGEPAACRVCLSVPAVAGVQDKAYR